MTTHTDRNRQNAMSSTGPRTPGGKAASAKNATTHGLTARTPLVDGESASDYAMFVDGVVLALRPDGTLERALAERAAMCLWRVQRAPRIEAALLAPTPALEPDFLTTALAHTNGLTLPEPTAPDVRAYTVNADELERVARYETHAERSAYRALAELRQVQAAKRNAPAPAPAA
jgi:hypothetical protein